MLALNGLQQVGNGVSPDDTSIYDEGNAFTEPLGFLDIVRGQENSRSGTVETSDNLPYLTSAGDIDAGGWFVKKQNKRLVDDTGREGKFTLHSLGIAGEITTCGKSGMLPMP